MKEIDNETSNENQSDRVVDNLKTKKKRDSCDVKKGCSLQKYDDEYNDEFVRCGSVFRRARQVYCSPQIGSGTIRIKGAMRNDKGGFGTTKGNGMKGETASGCNDTVNPHD